MAHHPANNGLVKLVSSRILNVMRHVIWSNSTSSDKDIPDIRCSISSGTVQFILYCEDKGLPYELLLSPQSPINTIDDFISTRLNLSQRIYRETRRLQNSNPQILSHQQKSARPKPVREGQLVRLMKHDTSGLVPKLSPKLSGPYRVIEKPRKNKCVSGICYTRTKAEFILMVSNFSKTFTLTDFTIP